MDSIKIAKPQVTLLYNNKIGNIIINNDRGIYGKYTSELPNKSVIKIFAFVKTLVFTRQLTAHNAAININALIGEKNSHI